MGLRSDPAPVCHASILSVALWLCLVTPFVLCHFILCHSFRTLCILIQDLLLLPVLLGNLIEKQLELALNNHVRKMIDSLDLPERIDSYNVTEPSSQMSL